MNTIYLGFNCNCFTNRYESPAEWTDLCRRLGVTRVMFNVDLIDPMWSWETQKRLCDETLNECSKKGITIQCSFGGNHGHRHFLGHPDEGCRREAEEFYRRAIRQTAYLGGKSFGTCFAILSVRSHKDRQERNRIMEDAVQAYFRLAEYGAELGLEAIAYEATSVSRESCATFAENDYVLDRCSGMKIPMRICLDMGHRNMGGTTEERDHCAWIRRYARHCDVIDCQQTDLQGSRHWPFTDEYNRNGIIDGKQVVDAIRESAERDILLALELRVPAYWPAEEAFVESMEASVGYWRKWVEE